MRRVVKLIIVECNDCPYLDKKRQYCNEMDDWVTDINRVPYNCPLEEVC